MNFDAFVNDIETNKWNVFGTEVYENGTLAHSWGDTTDNLYDIYSMTKTVLSIAVGIAYDRGLIDFKKSILDYLPREKVDSLSQSQLDTFKHITIHRLLTMSVDGFPFRAEGDSWLDFALSCEIKTPERRVFHYNNISPYLVGVAVTEALGSDLGAFIEEEIFKPLDITRYEYERSPEGYFYGASKMKFTVHDISKFGLLLYNKGVYNGKRILSEEYVEMATSIQQMNREGGYGFYIWKYRDGFSINGKWKQKVYIFPKRGIMVSYLSHIEDDAHDLRDSMDKNILSETYPAFPDYNNCLVNLANSVLNRFGVETTANTLPLADKYLEKKHRNVVVLLLDAMGTYILDKHLDDNGFFKSHLAGSYHSVYPPTTVAATTSLICGQYPNEHGWLGWDMYIPKVDKNVTLFTNTEQAVEKKDAAPVKVEADGTKVWDTDSYEEFVQAADYNVGFTILPYDSIVNKINNAGGKAYFSMPFMPPYPQDLDSIFERIENLCKEPGEKYIYAYWNEPDNTMHKTGTMSDATHYSVTDLEERVEKLASKLEDTLLIVTADHGHVDCKNICIQDYPEVTECLVRNPSIEPRTLNLYIKDEYKAAFPEIFKKNFGEEDFLLMTREEVLENKVFGIGKDRDDLAEMIGDYVAFSISNVAIFVSHYEAQVMPGGHAGLTPEEYIIPLIVIENFRRMRK